MDCHVCGKDHYTNEGLLVKEVRILKQQKEAAAAGRKMRAVHATTASQSSKCRGTTAS